MTCAVIMQPHKYGIYSAVWRRTSISVTWRLRLNSSFINLVIDISPYWQHIICYIKENVLQNVMKFIKNFNILKTKVIHVYLPLLINPIYYPHIFISTNRPISSIILCCRPLSRNITYIRQFQISACELQNIIAEALTLLWLRTATKQLQPVHW